MQRVLVDLGIVEAPAPPRPSIDLSEAELQAAIATAEDALDHGRRVAQDPELRQLIEEEAAVLRVQLSRRRERRRREFRTRLKEAA